MKDFFKIVLGSTVGFIIASILFSVLSFVLFFAMIGSMSSSFSSDTFTLKDNSVLHLRLSGTIQERVPEIDPFMALLSNNQPTTLGLNDIVSAIRKAKNNNKIKGIYIDSRSFVASHATLSEIRQELVRFKESGKFIVAYADNYLQGGYYLASVADKIVINPEGGLELSGLSSTPIFYKDALAKLGIEMQIFKVGTFKSAVEPFIQTKMSDANREQMTALLNDMWGGMRNSIAESRGLTPEKIDALADQMTFFQPTSFLLENGLVDALMYETEMRNHIRTLLNLEEDATITAATVTDMKTVPSGRTGRRASSSSNTVALLYATGNISTGSGSQGIQDRFMVNQIERLRKNDDVKAVVFRINSGGGSAYASEQIWRAISDLREVKPVIVSMGDVAASGGYYIAANATKIVAQPNTITGSIGIFGMVPNLEGASRKIGISTDVVKTNKFADFGNLTRPFNSDESAMMQSMVERGYDLFLRRCADGRGMTTAELAQFAEGRVWTGNQAKEIGLVDELGGIARAVELAVELADLGTNYQVMEFPRMRSPLEELLNRERENLAAQTLREFLGESVDLFMLLRDIRNEDYVQARLPFELNIR